MKRSKVESSPTNPKDDARSDYLKRDRGQDHGADGYEARPRDYYWGVNAHDIRARDQARLAERVLQTMTPAQLCRAATLILSAFPEDEAETDWEDEDGRA